MSENNEVERLLNAVRSNDIPSINFFLQAGKDVNVKNEWGYFPLYEAVKLKHVEALSVLLRGKINLGMEQREFRVVRDFSQLPKNTRRTSASRCKDRASGKLIYQVVYRQTAEEALENLPPSREKEEMLRLFEDYKARTALHWKIRAIVRLVRRTVFKFGYVTLHPLKTAREFLPHKHA